jgi:hypothetical protein
MGLSIAGKLILKCPVPTAYLSQRDGIFFFIPYLTVALAGVVGYLCLGGHNLYSPSFQDILFAAITGSIVACLFGLLGKAVAVTFFAENGISIVGRSGAFSAYKDIAECRVTSHRNWKQNFYVLDFTLTKSDDGFRRLLFSQVKTVAVAENMLEPVLHLLRAKGVKTVEAP